MTLELVAGRIIARHVGASLYTWTAVIGVVLGGITIGNWVGGRVADAFRARTSLAALFLLAAAGSLAIPFLNDWVGGWDWSAEDPGLFRGGWLMLMGWDTLKDVPWSLRIFLHVLVVFSLPSLLLGLIGPVVAKMALDLGYSTGRTVGNVYAWGALGSIAGTFATGFYLVAAFGTIAIVIGVAVVLALVGCLFASPIVAAVAPPVFLLSVYFASSGTWDGPWRVVWNEGSVRVLDREDLDDSVTWVDESQYSYIRVSRHESDDDDDPSVSHELRLDSLLHSSIDLEDIDDLHYDYEEAYRAVMFRATPPGEAVSALFIGGGGFVFPRFVRRHYPGSHIQVAEIDPAVTLANFVAFGLSPEEAVVVRSLDQIPPDENVMWIRNIDARNHVEDLVRARRSGKGVTFDFVFGDAFNDFTVPFHLTTVEFNRRVREILTPGRGVYMINVIDIYASGKFLGAVINTFEEVFPHVYAFANTDSGPGEEPDDRDTFVVVGSLRELDIDDLPTVEGPTSFTGSLLTVDHRVALRERSRGLLLTDDHAPVEQLLTEVVNRR